MPGRRGRAVEAIAVTAPATISAAGRLAVATFVMVLTLAACSGGGATNNESIPTKVHNPPHTFEHSPNDPRAMKKDMLASDYYRAVLDWCEMQGGNFTLTDEDGGDWDTPKCELGLNGGWLGIMVGIIGGVNVGPPTYWWGLRGWPGGAFATPSRPHGKGLVGSPNHFSSCKSLLNLSAARSGIELIADTPKSVHMLSILTRIRCKNDVS